MKRLVLFLLLCIPCFGQGYSLENFSQNTTGSAPSQTPLFNSWYGSMGSGTDSAFGCTIGTAACDIHQIANPSNALSVVAPASSVCGAAPASITGKMLDYATQSTTISPSYVVFNVPQTQASVQQFSFWFCSNIPVSANFGTTFDAFFNLTNNSRCCNYNSNGSSQNWGIEGASVGTIAYTPNNWVQVSAQHVNSGRCLDTTNFTDCDRVALTDINGNLIGQIAACDSAAGGNTSCAANTTTLSYLTLGNLNSITFTGSWHVQFANFKVCTQGCTNAQFPVLQNPVPPWDGIVTPGRGTDWTQAGIPGNNTGTLPSSAWAHCGPTLTAGSYTGATITTSLNGCSANSYYLLGAGTFNLTGQILIPPGVEVRGSGSNSTFLVWTGALSNCNQIGGAICMKSPTDGTYTTQPPPNTCTVSAGLTKGSTSITLANLAGTCKTGITANTTMLILDFCDTGYSGSPCSGTATDNSNWFVCGDVWNTTGCSQDGPDTGGSRTERDELEFHICTAYNSSTGVCTLSPPIINANAGSLSNPQVWIVQPGLNQGLQNLSIDLNGSGGGECWEGYNISNFWVSGVRCINASNRAFNCAQCSNGIIQNNYIYNVKGSPPSQYGIRLSPAGNMLIQNNIEQQVLSPFFHDGANTGNVIAYNFIVNDIDPSNTLSTALDDHAGNYYNLFEGNIANQFSCDDIHGTCDQETVFRNFLPGWESLPSNTQSTFTNAIADWAYARYTNNIANVLGTPGYHGTYSAQKSNTAVYWIGGGGSNGNGTIPNDALTKSTSLFWASYDSVTGAKRFCGNALDTGFGTTCSSTSESAFSASPYPAFVPVYGDTAVGQGALPASFYLSSKPGWWSASLAFPAIGPDIASGTVIQCGGSLNVAGKFNGVPALSTSQCAGSGAGTGWASLVNPTPAMQCALGTMSMPPDGSGSALAFDSGGCYSSTPTASTPTFSPVAGTYSGTQSVSISCSTGPIACYNTSGSPATNGTTGCSTGTLYSGAISVSSSETLYAVCGGTSFIDSAVGSAAYTINAASVPAPATNMILAERLQ